MQEWMLLPLVRQDSFALQAQPILSSAQLDTWLTPLPHAKCARLALTVSQPQVETMLLLALALMVTSAEEELRFPCLSMQKNKETLMPEFNLAFTLTQAKLLWFSVPRELTPILTTLLLARTATTAITVQQQVFRASTCTPAHQATPAMLKVSLRRSETAQTSASEVTIAQLELLECLSAKMVCTLTLVGSLFAATVLPVTTVITA